MNNWSTRDKSIRRVILIEGAANLIVLTAKVWVGITTGSLAVLGDAIHSLTDVANNIIAFVVIRLSVLPPDREHPYGHRKFETIAVFFLASLLVVLAFELAMNAIKREEAEIVSSAWGLGIMFAVLAVNISLASWQRMWARRLNSDILHADSSHTFADVLTTVVVIIGWQLSAIGYVWLDRLCALAVSALVFYLAYKLFRRATPILVDRFALDPEQLTKLIQDVAGVQQVKRVRSRWIGADKAVDVVISVNSELSTDDSHEIATAIESAIKDRFGVSDVAVHVEPFIK